jgi:hypothetical protein
MGTPGMIEGETVNITEGMTEETEETEETIDGREGLLLNLDTLALRHMMALLAGPAMATITIVIPIDGRRQGRDAVLRMNIDGDRLRLRNIESEQGRSLPSTRVVRSMKVVWRNTERADKENRHRHGELMKISRSLTRDLLKDLHLDLRLTTTMERDAARHPHVTLIILPRLLTTLIVITHTKTNGVRRSGQSQGHRTMLLSLTFH